MIEDILRGLSEGDVKQTKFQKFKLWFKIKSAMIAFWLIKNMVLLNVKMMQWKKNSKEYLKHPTAEGFKPNK